MTDCVFCKIIAEQIPATVILRNEHVIVIKDRAPQAPIHYLIIPLEHVRDITELPSNDTVTANAIIHAAQEIARTVPGAEQFRLLANNGALAGQQVFHLHFHFLAGM